MSIHGSAKRERVLDPIERLSEILFGLIMVLSFTCTISAASAQHEELRSMVIGALSCNFAWGIVDAVMYLMAVVVERSRTLAIARAVRASTDPARARLLIAEALPDPLDQLFDEPALEQARQKILALPQDRERPHLRRRDLAAALGIFLLVFLSTFPVIVPFLLPGPAERALRLSNAVAIAMLYLGGHLLARQAGLPPVRTGGALVALGAVLVAITIALGG